MKPNRISQVGDLSGIAEIKQALQLARTLHGGQLRAIGRDEGKPYFDTHVLRVVEAVPVHCKAAAALHDVLEDTGCQAAGLKKFTVETQLAVMLLTRPQGMQYNHYIDRVIGAWLAALEPWSLHEDPALGNEMALRATQIACRVKLADLTDNLSGWPEGPHARRYVAAIAKIAGSLEEDQAQRDASA